MGEKTGIAWTTSSWNPWIGCTEVSPGCDNCYARVMDSRKRWDGGRTHWGAGVPRYRTAASNWKQPLSWNEKAWRERPKRWTVFPSLCDPFDNEVPAEWRIDLFNLIAQTKNLTWLLLTKRIGNAAKMIPNGLWVGDPTKFFPNVWLGASVVNQEEADRDIPKLLATPAAKRFVSYEPALGLVDFARAIPGTSRSPLRGGNSDGLAALTDLPGLPRLDWIIVGGESAQGGAKARPFDLAWARQTVAQCKAAGVPVFVKQLGSTAFETDPDPLHGHFRCGPGYAMARNWLRLKDRAGADPAEWAEDLRVQEFPA